MSIGASVLEGYVPEVDATIVTRILDAGGTIIGKAVCGAFCMEGSSFTASTGLIPNPHKPSHAAGGSSSGSAALVAAGAVDVAVGADQGGSLRIPAAWCGLYGMKPTFGLVPYSGIASIEFTLDHAGPMAANLEDMTRLLQAMAGPDGIDPRQPNIEPPDYLAALEGGVRGLRIACLAEGFERPGERAGRGRAGAGGAQALRGAWRRSQHRPPADASGGHAHLGRDRARGRGAEHAQGRRRRGESAGLPDHLAARRERPRAAPPAERSGTDRHSHPPLRRIHAARLSRPLLRQGTEPAPHPPRRLRRRAGGARS